MTYNPFKYFWARTMWYARQPLTWLLDLIVMSVVFGVFILEGALSLPEISVVTAFFWLVWSSFRLVLRLICSVFVCWAAKRHYGFKQEYYDCVFGR